jgi:hypothetical protein
MYLIFGFGITDMHVIVDVRRAKIGGMSPCEETHEQDGLHRTWLRTMRDGLH